MGRKKSNSEQSQDERLVVVNAILATLAADDEPTRKFEFDLIDKSTVFLAGECYVPGLDIALVRDINRILTRLKKAAVHVGPIVIGGNATFKNYREFDTQLIHYFRIQPHNFLLKLEAMVNSDEWENGLPVPLYGHVYSYGDEKSLKKDFDSLVKGDAKRSIDFSIKNLKEALSQLDESARAHATKGILSKLERALL